MKEERLSQGFVVILQSIMLSFFLLFYGLLWFSFRNPNFDTEAWMVLFFIISVSVFIIWRLLSLADVYVSSDQIIYKKIIGIRRLPISTIKTVKKALFSPNIYYIEFKDGRKVYFQLKSEDIWKRFYSWGDENILEELRMKLRLR